MVWDAVLTLCCAVVVLCCAVSTFASGGGELLSWDLSNLPPQTHERHSWKVYNEDGQDSDEGSDGEGPIFKGTTVSDGARLLIDQAQRMVH
jgi:hypothetical protein